MKKFMFLTFTFIVIMIMSMSLNATTTNVKPVDVKKSEYKFTIEDNFYTNYLYWKIRPLDVLAGGNNNSERNSYDYIQFMFWLSFIISTLIVCIVSWVNFSSMEYNWLNTLYWFINLISLILFISFTIFLINLGEIFIFIGGIISAIFFGFSLSATNEKLINYFDSIQRKINIQNNLKNNISNIKNQKVIFE